MITNLDLLQNLLMVIFHIGNIWLCLITDNMDRGCICQIL